MKQVFGEFSLQKLSNIKMKSKMYREEPQNNYQECQI